MTISMNMPKIAAMKNLIVQESRSYS